MAKESKGKNGNGPPKGGNSSQPGDMLSQIRNFKKNKLHSRRKTRNVQLKKLSGMQQVSLIDKLKERMVTMRSHMQEESDEDEDEWSD